MPKHSDPNKLRFYFEPLPVPEDIADWQDWQDICVRIPLPLIPYLTPIMRIWQSPGCLIASDMDRALFIELWTDLIGRINTGELCDIMIMLRQNPSNSCQLQQSFDNGVNWSLAFDYSLCVPQSQVFLTQTGAQEQLDKWQDAPTLEDIHPAAPSDTFTSQPADPPETVVDREKALCYAAHIYVNAYVENVRKINADAVAWANLGNTVISIAAAIAAISAAASGGATLPLYLALSAAMAAAGTAGYAALTNEVLSDADAVNSVACQMYNNLRGLTTTQENFATAFDGVLSGNAEIIRATIAVDIGNEAGLKNQFDAFVNLLGDLSKPASMGVIDDCTCPAPLEIIITPFADCMGNGDTTGTIAFVSGDLYDLTLTVDPSPAFSVHFSDAHGQRFCYQLVDGTIVSSAVRDIGGNCDFSGIGFGAIAQNEQILECSLYDVTAKTVRIRFYRTPD